MPHLNACEKHKCFVCLKILSRRPNLKKHLMSPTIDGKARCVGLKKVITSGVWKKDILPLKKVEEGVGLCS